MPDDNRFAGLGAGLHDEDEEEKTNETNGSTETDGESAPDQQTQNAAEALDDRTDASTNATSTPHSSTDDESADTVVSESIADDGESGDRAGDDESESGKSDDGETDEEGPAFEFEETTAKSIYVRDETLALLEDTEFEVEMCLRKDHAIRDVTGREFHDAAVHVLENHVDEVVDAILEARDE